MVTATNLRFSSSSLTLSPPAFSYLLSPGGCPKMLIFLCFLTVFFGTMSVQLSPLRHVPRVLPTADGQMQLARTASTSRHYCDAYLRYPMGTTLVAVKCVANVAHVPQQCSNYPRHDTDNLRTLAAYSLEVDTMAPMVSAFLTMQKDLSAL